MGFVNESVILNYTDLSIAEVKELFNSVTTRGEPTVVTKVIDNKLTHGLNRHVQSACSLITTEQLIDGTLPFRVVDSIIGSNAANYYFYVDGKICSFTEVALSNKIISDLALTRTLSMGFARNGLHGEPVVCRNVKEAVEANDAGKPVKFMAKYVAADGYIRYYIGLLDGAFHMEENGDFIVKGHFGRTVRDNTRW